MYGGDGFWVGEELAGLFLSENAQELLKGLVSWRCMSHIYSQKFLKPGRDGGCVFSLTNCTTGQQGA